jgi:hypothetical protein
MAGSCWSLIGWVLTTVRNSERLARQVSMGTPDVQTAALGPWLLRYPLLTAKRIGPPRTMSSRLDKSWIVLASHQVDEGNRCVDIFSRTDGTYGFEEFRRDPEDMGAWTPVSYFSGREYPTESDVARRRSQRRLLAGSTLGSLTARSPSENPRNGIFGVVHRPGPTTGIPEILPCLGCRAVSADSPGSFRCSSCRRL